MYTARTLGPQEYGIFAAIQVTVNTIAIVLGGSLFAPISTTFSALFREKKGVLLGAARSLVLLWIIASVLGAMLYFFSGIITKASNQIGELSLAAIMAPVVWSSAHIGQQLVGAALLGLRCNRQQAQASLLQATILTCLAYPLVNRWGVIGILWGLAASAAAGFVANLRTLFSVGTGYSSPPLRHSMLMLVGGPVLSSSSATILSHAANWGALSLLASGAGGPAEVGLVMAANTIRQMLQFFPAQVVRLAASRLGGRDLTTPRLPTLGLAIACYAVPCFVLLCVAPQMMSIFGQTYYRADAMIIRVVLAGGLFEVVAQAVQTLLLLEGRNWPQLIGSAVWALMVVTVTALWREQYGARAYALASAAAWLSSAGVMWGLRAIAARSEDT